MTELDIASGRGVLHSGAVKDAASVFIKYFFLDEHSLHLTCCARILAAAHLPRLARPARRALVSQVTRTSCCQHGVNSSTPGSIPFRRDRTALQSHRRRSSGHFAAIFLRERCAGGLLFGGPVSLLTRPLLSSLPRS